MNIDELRIHRSNLEKDLLSSVSAHLDNFRRLTGMSPHGVYVNLERLRTVGNAEDEYVATGVRVGLEL